MKQRLKEIGLYNILGMEKRHIAVMMFFENVFVFITVFVSGNDTGNGVFQTDVPDIDENDCGTVKSSCVR